MILDLIDEATTAGARVEAVCETVGISLRTAQRWRRRSGGDDLRCGPRTTPRNKLSASERTKVLNVANSPEFRDLPPHQIVPKLADRGEYVCSEATMYRVLKAEKQSTHRGKAQEPQQRRPPELIATGPQRVWSWDITYLRGPTRGAFFYLYMVVDIWSRKIVGWSLHESESMDFAASLIEAAIEREGCSPDGLYLHSDNGGPMRGSTMLATLQRLGIVPSFSRPRVSDDNPFSESLFKTLKYRPGYPSGAFDSLLAARNWVTGFVAWYNTRHLHSAVRYVTPDDRHDGRDQAILKKRKKVYEAARARHPERWTGDTRNWNPIKRVCLNATSATLIEVRNEVAA